MSDDSDLLIAAAATAALFTWMGTRGRGTRASVKRKWSKMTATVAAALKRTWRETPGYVFVTAIVELLRRKK
jgi:hypothetical protein